MAHHRVTRLGAAPAVFRTLAVARFFTGLGTGVAHLGACLAGRAVQRRPAQDEICRRVTDLDAILQDANVIRLGVPPAFLQTMLNFVQARVVAFFAVMQAFVIFLAQVFVNIAHFILLRFMVSMVRPR